MNAELFRLFWDCAVTRALRRTAFAERRFDDVNYYDKCLEAIADEYRELTGDAREIRNA